MTLPRMTPTRALASTAALALALALAAPAASARDVEVAAFLHDYFHIVPEIVNAEEGDVLKVSAQNAGQAPHDIFFCGDEGLGAPPQSCARPIGGPVAPQPGATLPLEVTVPAPGTYWYYCTIPGHAAQGMAGKLVVAGGQVEEKPIPAAGLLVAIGAAAIGALALRRRV